MGPHPGVAWIRETRPQMAPPWRAVHQNYTGCVLSSDVVLQRTHPCEPYRQQIAKPRIEPCLYLLQAPECRQLRSSLRLKYKAPAAASQVAPEATRHLTAGATERPLLFSCTASSVRFLLHKGLFQVSIAASPA